MSSIGEILKLALKRKQSRNPTYSLRALARDAQLSASFLSKVFNDEKPLPRKHVLVLSRLLEMDSAARKSVDVRLGKYPPAGCEPKRAAQESLPDTSYAQADFTDYWILEDWYNLAIVDLITCSDFVNDPAWVAARLDIRDDQARLALQRLERCGLIRAQGGTLVKSKRKMRFTSTQSQELIRKFHREMLERGARSMKNPNAFEKRQITGLTVAANPSRLAEAKEILQDAMYRAAEVLAQGDCSEVYNLSSVLFPLTKSK